MERFVAFCYGVFVGAVVIGGFAILVNLGVIR